MSFRSDIDELNSKVMDAFADPDAPITYVSADPQVNPALINSIPIDPIRLGDSFPNTFTVVWVQESDLSDLGIVAARGDQVIIGDPNGPTGSSITYTVDQIQNDMGGGIRLILAKR